MRRKLFYVLCVLIALLACINVILYKKTVQAADAIPDPMVPCSDQTVVNGKNAWEDPEFNSLRPYQASPCRDAPYASMCGNTLRILLEEVETNYDPNRCEGLICPYTKGPSQIDVVVDLSGVELPILGNTEQTVNSQNTADQMSDAQKVNEYTSWYLAGTNQKAEYGLDTQDKVINYSGPAKKLTPSTIQELIRFKTLQNAGVKPEFTNNDLGDDASFDLDPVEPGIQTEETDNHNQIVVCTSNDAEIEIFGLSIPIPWVGAEKPIPCYGDHNSITEAVNSGVSGAIGGILGNLLGNAVTGEKADQTNGEAWRLLKWWEGKQVPYGQADQVIPNWDPTQRWSSTVPPFPWQFTESWHYQKAYNEWRGKECITILGTLNCIDIRLGNTIFDLHTNAYADLYQYIPLSNTTDRKGKEEFDNVPINAPRATFAGRPELGTIINTVPRLYYPHTTETFEAAQNLNKTYLPLEGVNTKSISPRTDDNVSGKCKILDVRTNPGDDLTFDNTQEKHQINFQVNYEIDSIECREESTRTVPVFDPLDPTQITGYTEEIIWDCSSDVYATVDLTTLAPELNNIWKETTAGSGSTFRRIFPKVEEGAPVSCVADIPGVSAANFALNGESDSSVRLLRVLNPGDSPAANPEIYFPHLGSVYEYFLKGIQTALRPKGYGEPLVNGLCESETGTVDGDCGFDLQRAYAAINAAAAKYDIPQLLLRTIFELESGPYIANPESYQCVENSSGAAGIGQIKRSTYEIVTCADEELADDINVCADPRTGKLSRCNVGGAAELMARILLFSAGKWEYGPNTCRPTGGLSLSNKLEWYDATCNYGTGTEANTVTINYQNSIPASERPNGRDMNYCDVICHLMGECPSYPR